MRRSNAEGIRNRNFSYRTFFDDNGVNDAEGEVPESHQGAGREGDECQSNQLLRNHPRYPYDGHDPVSGSTVS